ncbi:hypothetical protein [Rhodopseudomonas sp. P2A-2r]|nr:hypothetical protein [Rhodopseudomonas sp. P2A-2r]UZE46768.1 hypothetical protein ONR75_17045 [Rhodopseudomonas sp. P2A-2r]
MSERKSDAKVIQDLSDIRARLDAMPTKKKLVILAIGLFIAASIFRHFGL